MAPAKKGGFGSAIGCLLVLGGLGFGGYRYGPGLLALLRGESAAISWGLEYEKDGLRVKVVSAGIMTTEIDDALGRRDGDEDLHVTIEITNMSDATLTYRTPRLLRASEPKLVDDDGRAVQAVAEARIEGQLDDGTEIQARRRAKHDCIFKKPSEGAEYFVLSVDLACLGRREVVLFRVPASEIKGLR